VSTQSWPGCPAATAKVAFSMHAFLNPMISVDGDTATGSWLLWIASIYDDDPGAPRERARNARG
jgi:hypothetical protein